MERRGSLEQKPMMDEHGGDNRCVDMWTDKETSESNNSNYSLCLQRS